MSMTDNIADMLTRIRNGQKSKLLNVNMPASKLKCAVLDVLKMEGYISGYIFNGSSIISLIFIVGSFESVSLSVQ